MRGAAGKSGWVLLALLVGTLALGVTAFQTKAPPATAKPASREPAAAAPVSAVQIVAHPDDDLFFMNPDLQQTIGSGAPVATIYVSAAESNGKNVRKDDADVPGDKPGYVAARHAGVRRAYAKMAIGRAEARWTTTAMATPAGPVETSRLAERPGIKLVFLDVAQMDGAGKPTQLRGLVRGELPAVHTVLGRGGPVPKEHTYDREQLVGTLTALLQRFRPSVLRMQDPAPERGWDRHGADHQTDHPDHTATALLTRQALERYEQTAGSPVVVEAYRGYYNRHWPHNLSPQAAAQKVALISVYGWADKDHVPCPEKSGCGDLRVAGTSAKGGWPQSTHHRYPGTTRWLTRQADGRLAAYAVVSGRVVRWQERSPGGPWQAGTAMSERGFTPDLAVVPLADGRAALLGVRVQPAVRPGDPGRHHVMVTVQTTPAGPYGGWVDLGNPDAHGTDVGTPAAAIDGTGRLHVFVRDSALGVSQRTQDPQSAFGPWRSIGGGRVQDGLAAATDRTGRIELAGAATPVGWSWKKASPAPGLWTWRQREAGGPMGRGLWFGPPAQGAIPVIGPLTMTADPGGTLTLLARIPGSGQTAVFRQDAAGAWPARPAVAAGPGGFGPVGAVAPAPGVLGLAGRDGQGGVGIFETGTWHHPGGLFVQSPGVALDARGQLTVAVLGIDGRLHVAGRSPDSSWRWKPVPATP